MTMVTTSYRGHFIHCKVEGNREECRIQRPDLSQVKGASRSVEGAKKRIRAILKKR